MQLSTSISGIKDVGVESYYASGGLINSTTDASVYSRGSSITLKNVTVENNSYGDISDVRIRFSLSKDRTITTSDYQLGGNDSYWSWDSFSGETYNVSDYTTTIPSNVHLGTYYVEAIVKAVSINKGIKSGVLVLAE